MRVLGAVFLGKPMGLIFKRVHRGLLLSLPLCACGLLAVAQAAAPQQAGAPPPSPASRQEPHLVQRPPEDAPNHGAARELDVVVTDSAGKLATGIGQDAFTVLDNGLPQPITAFQAPGDGRGAAASPAEITLLIDTVNSSFARVAFVRQQVRSFLLMNGGALPQPVSVALLADDGLRMNPVPLRDGKTLAAEVERIVTPVQAIGPAAGANGAIDRFQISLDALTLLTTMETKRAGRKVVIWLGPGWPLLESGGFRFAAPQQRRFFDSFVTITRRLEDARMTLYAIDPLDLSTGTGLPRLMYTRFLQGPRTAREASPGKLAEQVFAIHSGGLALDASGNVAAQIAGIVAEAQASYTLTYRPAAGQRTDEYHEIEVRVKRPGLVARTRRVYYAQP